MAQIFNAYCLSLCSRMVRARDKFECQLCLNVFPSFRLDSHHIKPKEQFPELAYHLDNQITLCKKCHHRVTHSDPRNVRRFVMLWWPYLNRKAIVAYHTKYQQRITNTANELTVKAIGATNNE